MKSKTREDRPVKFDYEDIDNRLSEIHFLAVQARDQAQLVIQAVADYKQDLLSARVKFLREKLGDQENPQ